MMEDEMEMSKEEFRRWIRDQVEKIDLLQKYNSLQSLLERRKKHASNLLELRQSVTECEKTAKELYSLLGWEYRDDSDDGEEPTFCGHTQPFQSGSSRCLPTCKKPAPQCPATEDKDNLDRGGTNGRKQTHTVNREAVVVLDRLSRFQINKALRQSSPQSKSSEDSSLSSHESDKQWEPSSESSDSDFSNSEFNVGSNKRRKVMKKNKLENILPTSRTSRTFARKTKDAKTTTARKRSYVKGKKPKTSARLENSISDSDFETSVAKATTSQPSTKKRTTPQSNTAKMATPPSNTTKTTTPLSNTTKTTRPPSNTTETTPLSNTTETTPLSNTTETTTPLSNTTETTTPLSNTTKTTTPLSNTTTPPSNTTKTTRPPSNTTETTPPSSTTKTTTPPSKTTKTATPLSNTKTSAKSEAVKTSANTTGKTPVNDQSSKTTETPASVPQVELSVNMTVLARRRALSWQLGKITEIITKEDGRIKYKVIFEEKGRCLVSGHHIAFKNIPTLSQLFVGARVVIKQQADFLPGVLVELPSRKNRMRFLVFVDDHTPVYIGLPLLHLVCRPLPDPLADIPDENHRNFLKKYLKVWPYPPLTQYTIGNLVNVEHNGVQQKCEVIQIDCSLMEVIFKSDEHKEWIFRGSMRLEHIVRLKMDKA